MEYIGRMVVEWNIFVFVISGVYDVLGDKIIFKILIRFVNNYN